MVSASVVMDGKLHMIGGSSAGDSLTTTLVYDPATDAWSERPQLETARFRLGGALIQKGALILGGWEPVWTPHGAVEVLRPCGPHLHVEGILMKSRDRGGKYVTASSVLIADANGWPVPGATVRVVWTLPDETVEEQEAVTHARGRTRYRVKSKLEGTYEVCVSDVDRMGSCYDPSQNVENCDTLVVP
jgi:hypothetical protein